MKTTFKLITAFMLALSMLGLYAPAVLAAAPGNDVFSGATAVASLPFSDSVDTTQATTGGYLQRSAADGRVSFTDGSVVWLDGPCGIQNRRAGDRLADDFFAPAFFVDLDFGGLA